jgi:lysophospholipase L1-like esterase
MKLAKARAGWWLESMVIFSRIMTSAKTASLTFFAVTLCLLVSCRAPQSNAPIRESDYPSRIRVACVGDSITYGLGISDRERNSYPAQLGTLLGEHWEVRNFGFNGASAIKDSPKPYLLLPVFDEALSYQPDVVIIQLGTNDTSPKTWPAHKQQFIADYLAIVRRFQGLATRPRIYLCRPVPLFRDRGKDYDTDKILTEEVIPKINAIATQNHFPVIDLYAALDGNSGKFWDGVHPKADGARIMAATIVAKLKGQPQSTK